MQIGRITIEPVVDGRILSKLTPTKPFPKVGSSAWTDQGGMFHAGRVIESTVGGFLIRTADRLALVDAGAGQAFPDGYRAPAIDVDDPDDAIAAAFRARGLTDDMITRAAEHFAGTHVEQGRLPASLEELGVDTADVTDLIFTHLHFDHIGWASADGAACFPNATVRCAAADLDHFLAGPDEEQFTALVYGAPTAYERLGPVLERIETWDADTNVLRGIDVRLAPGHTPGSSVIVVSDGAARALLLGDIIHCPLELMDDDFNLLVDHDQELANRVRVAYARELEGTDVVAAAAHFPGLQFGRLLPSEHGARRFSFA
jgi:glyoxylase-like metal-dependent hydrolase (beta-lactamase superfamily II)